MRFISSLSRTILRLVPFAVFVVPLFAFAQSSASAQPVVQLTVFGCNDNGICEPQFGETADTCPLDCQVTPPVCTDTTPYSTDPSCFCSYHPDDSQCQSVGPTCTDATPYATDPYCYCSFHGADDRCVENPPTCDSSTPYSSSPSCFCSFNPNNQKCGSVAPPNPTNPTGGSPVGGGSGYVAVTGNHPLYIKSLVLTQERTAVTVTWVTSNNTLSTLYWGTSPDHEIGSIGGAVYTAQHVITLNDLIPGTKYYIGIFAKDLYGAELHYAGIFNTASIPNHNPPANVSHIVLKQQSNGLVISWQNPPDQNFAGVRMTRSPYAYPQDQNDGKVIYEGGGTYAVDHDIVPGSPVFYYSIFSYNSNDEFSSGAIFSNKHILISGPSGTSSIPLLGSTTALTFDDLQFVQGGALLKIVNDQVTIDGGKDFVVSLGEQYVPAYAQETYMAITTPLDVEGYSLHLNQDNGMYESQVNLAGYPAGIYPITVTIVPNGGSPVSISGTLNVQVMPIPSGDYTWLVFLIIVIILALLLIFIVVVILTRPYFIVRKNQQPK